MKRRQFIALLGGAAAWPLSARAQQPTLPVIGFLGSASAEPSAGFLAMFRSGLEETGYVEGQNVAIEYRWAEGQYDRLPGMAADLVRRRVAVIVSTAGAATVLAAKSATSTISIVFSAGGDPVKMGLVASLNRPGRNLTGVVVLTSLMDAKRLGLLREMVPAATLIAVLANPRNPSTKDQLASIREGARSVGQNIATYEASSDAEIEGAFAKLKSMGAQALLVAADPVFNARREFLVALAARHAVPAIYEFREYAVAAGLMSYGPHVVGGFWQGGLFYWSNPQWKPPDLPVFKVLKFKFL